MNRWLILPARRLIYWLTTVVVRFLITLTNDVRCIGIENWPIHGGGLVCANHQSFLDPILIGSLCPRPMNYLARESLFRSKPLAILMRLYHAIPLQRDGLGIAGLKESLRRLKNGELLLIFPEGTRSADGELKAVQAGFSILARRAKVPIIPVCIDGPFQMWPRSRRWPKLAGVRLRLIVGEPIDVMTMENSTDADLVDLLQSRMQELLRRLRP